MVYHITCSTDDNYLQHCVAMLCSLFENNSAYTFQVHLLFDSLSKTSQDSIKELCDKYDNEIKFYHIGSSDLGSAKIAEHHPDLSIATYYRILLPSLLDENIDRLLYLDCDVIVLRDLSALYQMDLEGYGVAAVKDCTPESDRHRQIMGLALDDCAFCAGVMMINLQYWREHDCQRSMLQFIENHHGDFIMEDQDVLNHEFRRHWLILPYKYGRTPMAIVPLDSSQKWNDYQEYVQNPAIIHYATYPKPWFNISIPDDQYYWKYVKLSGFANPQRFVPSDRTRKIIQQRKVRYYLNYYIHPFVPDFLEMFLRDVLDVVVVLTYVFRPKQFRMYRVRRWLRKYGVRV